MSVTVSYADILVPIYIVCIIWFYFLQAQQVGQGGKELEILRRNLDKLRKESIKMQKDSEKLRKEVSAIPPFAAMNDAKNLCVCVGGGS
jgi:uncharacterized protein YlxW (UPF0749 family)